MGANVCYATRERVMRAADVKSTAYLTSEVDRALAAASRRVDDLCKRGDSIRPGFAPWTGTITYDWPSAATGNTGSSFRLWLGRNSLLSLTAATSAGVSILADTYGSPVDGPPYDAISLDRSTSSVLSPGDAAGQRSVALTGVWSAAPLNEDSAASWTIGSNPSASSNSWTINAPIGVGSIVRCDSERVIVTERQWASSGVSQTMASSMTATTITTLIASSFFVGEELLVDSERMLIRDIGTNVLIVQRAWAGTTLAAHTAAVVNWGRLCTVERGALGTTAASHTSGTAVSIYSPPPLIEQLTVAYALDQRAQESSGYARTVGVGESERNASGAGLRALEDRVYAAYGRKVRHRAV